ncbi:MAG: hypothetical protein ACFFG0_35135 [Candidatus Thorarchaeota archaeon]
MSNKKVNWYDKQQVDVQDMDAEQLYHVSRQKNAFSRIFSDGVISGLAVSDDSTAVTQTSNNTDDTTLSNTTNTITQIFKATTDNIQDIVAYGRKSAGTTGLLFCYIYTLVDPTDVTSALDSVISEKSIDINTDVQVANATITFSFSGTAVATAASMTVDSYYAIVFKAPTLFGGTITLRYQSTNVYSDGHLRRNTGTEVISTSQDLYFIIYACAVQCALGIAYKNGDQIVVTTAERKINFANCTSGTTNYISIKFNNASSDYETPTRTGVLTASRYQDSFTFNVSTTQPDYDDSNYLYLASVVYSGSFPLTVTDGRTYLPKHTIVDYVEKWKIYGMIEAENLPFSVVVGSSNDEYSTIQSAVDAITTGDIFIKAGTYTEEVDLSAKSNITLIYENGAKHYRPSNTQYCITSINTSGNETSNIKIINADLYGNSKTGAIELLKAEYTDNISLINCQFDGNSSSTAAYKDFVINQCDGIVLQGNKVSAYNSYNITNFTLLKNDDYYRQSFGNDVVSTGQYSQSFGNNNDATGDYAYTEGNGNTASGNSSHAEGNGNTASAHYAHTEGYGNTSSGVYAHTEGNLNTASGNSSHASNRANTASGTGSHAEGHVTTASGNYSHAEGEESYAYLDTSSAFSSGKFAIIGDAQYIRYLLRGSTTNNSATELTSPARFTINDEHSYACTVTIVGRQDTGANNAMYKRMCVIERTSGTVALEGAAQTIGTDIEGNAAWDVSLTADDTNKSLKVSVTGDTGQNVRWVALIEAVMVGYSD